MGTRLAKSAKAVLEIEANQTNPAGERDIAPLPTDLSYGEERFDLLGTGNQPRSRRRRIAKHQAGRRSVPEPLVLAGWRVSGHSSTS